MQRDDRSTWAIAKLANTSARKASSHSPTLRWPKAIPANPRGLNVVIGDCDPLGSFALRNTGFNSIHTTAAFMSVVRFISVQATDNAARPSELVKRAYELRPLKIDRRYQRSTQNHSKRKKPYSK